MRFAFIITILLAPLLAMAQLTTGTVQYEETIELNIEVDEETSKFAHLLPSSQSNNFILRFTPEKAHYTVLEDDAPPPPQSDGEATFQIKIVRSSDNSAVYTDFAEQQMIEQRSIFGRPFRIEHQLTGGKWKLTNEQKDILGYTCFKATTGADSTLVTAWFTPQIAISSGPATYGQLPGIILEVTRDNISIVATSVSDELGDPSLMTAPTKGKVVTEEKFEQLQQEKMEEMNMGNGRRIEIRGE